MAYAPIRCRPGSSARLLVPSAGLPAGGPVRHVEPVPAGWVAVYEGYFLGDQTTQQAVLHDTPELAACSILQAHLHGL